MNLPVLSTYEERLLARQDAERVSPPTSMQSRIRDRLHARVHDVFAMEARAASLAGDPLTEYSVRCPVPKAYGWPTCRDEDDFGHLYPFCLGPPLVRKRVAWLAEHAFYLSVLEAG